MSLSFNWQITGVRALPEVEGKVNVVHKVGFILTATDSEDGKTAQYANEATLSIPSSEESFTPYDQLDEDTLIEWVKDALGEDHIAKWQDVLLPQEIQNQRVSAKPLPWSPDPPPPLEPPVEDPA